MPISDLALLSRLSMQSETQDLEALKQQQLDQPNILPLNCPPSLSEPAAAPSIAIDQSQLMSTHLIKHPLQTSDYPCVVTNGASVTNLKPTQPPLEVHENIQHASFALPASNSVHKLPSIEVTSTQMLANQTYTNFQKHLEPHGGNVYHSNDVGFTAQRIMNKLEPMDNLEYSIDNTFSSNILQSSQPSSNDDCRFINPIMQLKCDQIQAPLPVVSSAAPGVVNSSICSPSPDNFGSASQPPFMSSYNTHDGLQQQQSMLPQNEHTSSSSQGVSKMTFHSSNQVHIVSSSSTQLTQSEAEQAVNSILL